MPRRLSKSFGCPTEFALAVLGGKWKTVILCYLKFRPMRYGELRRLLPRVSDKVLSERLRDLEAVGLVTRAVERGAPAVIVYSLSARGDALRPMLSAVYKWGLENAAAYGVHCDYPPDRAADAGITSRAFRRRA